MFLKLWMWEVDAVLMKLFAVSCQILLPSNRPMLSIIILVTTVFALDILVIQLDHRLPEKLEPEGFGLVLVLPELVIKSADGSLTEAFLEVLQEVGRVLVAPVPI